MDDLSVTDPSDFPNDAPGLRELDAALRCTICLELFDAPTTTSCGHCFCSMCIRNFLATSDESVCPKCRKSASEHLLRPNPVLEEAIIAWKMARPTIMQLYVRLEALNERARSPKKRKIERVGDVSGASNSKPKRRTSSEHTDDDEIMFVQSSEVEEITFDSLVICPSCDKKIKHGLINKHLDSRCVQGVDTKPKSKSKGKSKAVERDTWSKIFTGPKSKGAATKNKLKEDAEPLPMPTYATLKDKQIKDLLLAYELPVTGDRATLTTRHEQWVRLYNANLDRSPKLRHTLAELRTQLKKSETPQSRRRGSKPAVDDVVAHQIKYREQFAELVEQARPKTKAKGAEVPPQNSSQPVAPPGSSQASSDSNNDIMALDL